MLMSLASLWERNVKKSEKLMKIVNIDGENYHIFWTTWRISMNFSGKMWLTTVLKFTKKQGFTLFLEDSLFKKPQAGEGGGSNGLSSLLSFKKVGNYQQTFYVMTKNNDKNKNRHYITFKYLDFIH